MHAMQNGAFFNKFLGRLSGVSRCRKKFASHDNALVE
jgi:hypothetical protein